MKDYFRSLKYKVRQGIWGASPIYFYNSPQELLKKKRLELLGGSLAAGNNGV